MEPNVQTRRLKPDENLIFHLIKSQSSTLITAMRELVQNAYDAGATRCDLTVTEHGFSIHDTGRGFADADEVEQFFETFGTPHPEAYEDKFGRFRMGRCQIMAFAPTCWQSNQFEMRVDIRNRGLAYELCELTPCLAGCSIAGNWYEPLHPNDLHELLRGLRNLFRYFHLLPLWVNGERVSRSLNELEILAESEDCYLIADKNRTWTGLYNLGVYVNVLELERQRWDFPGILLTKRHLTLDISRQHVQPGCPVWARIEAYLRKHYPRKLVVRQYPTKAEIRAYFQEIARQDVTVAEIRHLALFTDPARTRRYTLDQLARRPYTFAIPGYKERLADQLSQQGNYIVLNIQELVYTSRAHTYDEAIEWLHICLNDLEVTSEWVQEDDMALVEAVVKNYVPFDLVRVPADTDERVMEADLTPTELCAFKAIRTTNYKMLRMASQQFRAVDQVYMRELWIGNSARRLGWTDGRSYIALERGLLKLLSKGMVKASEVAAVLVHEWCHSEGDNGQHDARFYRLYHDLTIHPKLNLLPAMAYYLNMHYEQNLRQQGLRVPHAVEKYRFNIAIIGGLKSRQKEVLRGQRNQTRQAEQVFWELYQVVKDTPLLGPLPKHLQAVLDRMAQYAAERPATPHPKFYGAGVSDKNEAYTLPYLIFDNNELPGYPCFEAWEAAFAKEEEEWQQWDDAD